MKPSFPAYLQKLFDKYKYILLVCLVGLLLMLWPQGSEKTENVPAAAGETQTDAETLARSIENLLETMEGVGQASVLLTVERSQETAYAYHQTESRTETSGTRQTELVTVSQSGGQAPIPLQTTATVYRGAVVVCEGGGSAAIRLAVTQVIQSLTGISADRIVISKMK